jgi:hypothetical protein
MLRRAVVILAAAASGCLAFHPADLLPPHARGGALYRRLLDEKAEESATFASRFGKSLKKETFSAFSGDFKATVLDHNDPADKQTCERLLRGRAVSSLLRKCCLLVCIPRN